MDKSRDESKDKPTGQARIKTFRGGTIFLPVLTSCAIYGRPDCQVEDNPFGGYEVVLVVVWVSFLFFHH